MGVTECTVCVCVNERESVRERRRESKKGVLKQHRFIARPTLHKITKSTTFQIWTSGPY